VQIRTGWWRVWEIIGGKGMRDVRKKLAQGVKVTVKTAKIVRRIIR
jgi:hypothetical protein